MKSLIATGALRLATEGRLDLDAPVGRYLPDLAINNPWRDASPVTMRHLLDHTSGLEDARLWQMFSRRAKPDATLAKAFPDPHRLLRVRSRPGTRFSYSNMGYALAGMVVESVTGERYERYLDENLLRPLGMHDSTFEFTTQVGTRADRRLAWGHVDDGTRYAAQPIFLRPAGQFTTTASDLGRFAGFLMSDGRIDGVEFVAPELMRARGVPADTDAARNGLRAGYALGLGRRDRHDVVGYCHGGNIVGFMAMVCVYPDEGKAFAYSVNTDSETADYGRIAAVLANSLGLAPPAEPSTRDPARDARKWFGFYVPSPNRFAMFLYLDTLFGIKHLSARGSSIEFRSLQGRDRTLRPTGSYSFSADDRRTTSHVLLRGENGEYLISDGFGSFERVSGVYLGALWASLVAGIAGIIWFMGAGAALIVRERRHALTGTAMPAFLGSIGLFVPIPLFFAQPFMALGDMTPASLSLAAATLLLPLATLITVVRTFTDRESPGARKTHRFFGAAVLQWCAVLWAYNLLPFMLWS